MKIPLNFGGGGGSGSDDCTATAEDILESKTAIYDGSDDEAEYGSMKDYSGTTNAASAITQNGSDSRIELTVPNTGKYDTASKIYYAYSSLASTIGLTAAKIATGNTILGIAGTYMGLGSATQAQVLSGKTFSTASLSNASGTMTDKSGTSTSATSSVSGSNVRLQIPANGYYNTSAYLTNSYSNMASTIGLTAAKIKYGETILGITGTWQGWVATSTDVYYNGSVGSIAGSIGTYTSGSYCSAKVDTNCIVLTQSKGNGNSSNYCGASFSTAISCAGYSKITVTYNITETSGSGTSAMRFALGLYTSRPTSGSAFDSPTYYVRWSSTSVGTYSLSIDLSSISQSLYVGVYGYNWQTGPYFTVEVTRIALS